MTQFKYALLVVPVVAAVLSAPAMGFTNMLVNPRFEDLDSNSAYGDGWGNWGNTGFYDFFGRPHASFFGDWVGNNGGVFQGAIPGSPGTTYQFDLLDARIESHWDADFLFGLEYYAADDSTKLGETIVLVNTAARITAGQLDGNVISMQGTAVPGTAFVRPLMRFENVNYNYMEEPQSNLFVFDTYLSVAPVPGQQYLKNPGFEDEAANGGFGDYWGRWGNTDFNEFFGAGNAHASFFADTIGNSGGVYQASVLGTPGHTYRFVLADVRIEDDFDADLFFGFEYYGEANGGAKLGETVEQIDTSTTGNGLSFEMTGTAVPGTVYVRPVIRFDNVGHSGGSQRNAFVFAAGMTDTESVPGDLNCSGLVDADDILPFVTALVDPALYVAEHPGCNIDNGNLNGDGAVDGMDVAYFVELLIDG